MNATQTIDNIAATKTAPVTAHPRPYQTYYYESTRNAAEDWQRTSRSCTVHGALRAAFMRLWDKRSMHADVYGPDGVRVAFITRRGNKFTVICV